MKIVRNFQKLERNACWALSRATRKIVIGGMPSQPFDNEERMSYATINLLNAWGSFQRAYFVNCLLGLRSPSGQLVTSSMSGTITSAQQAIGVAVLHFRRSATPRANGEWDSKDEPTWHDTNILLNLSQSYAFSNDSDIQQAFTFGFTAHRNLVVYRNYYAHKNRVTREKTQNVAIQYLIPTNLHPSAALLASPSSSLHTSLIQMWRDELIQTVGLLCS